MQTDTKTPHKFHKGSVYYRSGLDCITVCSGAVLLSGRLEPDSDWIYSLEESFFTPVIITAVITYCNRHLYILKRIAGFFPAADPFSFFFDQL